MPLSTHKAFILYQGRISPFGAQQVQQVCIDLLKHDVGEVTLLIGSGGGDVTAGVGIYSFLQICPITVHTHALGLCGSIAATIFLAGQTRTVTPGTSISLHAATFIEGPRKGEISPNTPSIYYPFQSVCDWSDEEIETYFTDGNEKFIRGEELLKKRIVTNLEDLMISKGSHIFAISPEIDTPVDTAILAGTTA